MRLLAAGAALVLVAGIAACAADAGEGEGEGPLTVYLSVPLSGKNASGGREFATGAEDALSAAGSSAGGHEIELKVLDETGGGAKWSPASAGANARTVTEDADTIAYIDAYPYFDRESDKGPTSTSLPITDLAETPQVVVGSLPTDVDVENDVRPPVMVDLALAAGEDMMRFVLDGIERAGEDGNDRVAVLDELRKLGGSPP